GGHVVEPLGEPRGADDLVHAPTLTELKSGGDPVAIAQDRAYAGGGRRRGVASEPSLSGDQFLHPGCRSMASLFRPTLPPTPRSQQATSNTQQQRWAVPMGVEPQALERSVLERKERDELATIAEAMGVKAGARTSKANLIGQILREAGIETDDEKPKRAAKAKGENGETEAASAEQVEAAAGTNEKAATEAG